MRRFALLIFVLCTVEGFARVKTPYQVTKLVELQSNGKGFCFVVQLGDLAYVGVSDDSPPSNLIVGDTIQARIDHDKLRIMTNKHWPDVEPDGSMKTRIVVRERIGEHAKLPSCALAVSVH
jgi:hypothetical protein